jgi:hypothetical protein
LTSDEWRLLRPQFDEVLDVVLPVVDERRQKLLRDRFSVGEQGFGMDLLVRLLLFERLPLDARTHGLVSHILAEMGPIPGDTLPYLSDPAGVTSLLDREGEPLRRRGLPPQRGSLTDGDWRGVCTFPTYRGEDQIREAAAVVAGGPVTAVLSNSRAWRSAPVDDVVVGHLATSAGDVRADFPVVPTHEWREPPHFIDPRRPALTELIVFGVRVNCTQLQEVLHPSDEEREVLRQLQLAAEYDELADALIARADQEWPHLDPDARRRARALLRSFDLPVEGCAHLNDRDATLARWAS